MAFLLLHNYTDFIKKITLYFIKLICSFIIDVVSIFPSNVDAGPNIIYIKAFFKSYIFFIHNFN